MMLTYQHPEAVKEFLKFAGIREERPSLAFLARVLGVFSRFPYENLTKIIKAHTAGDDIERLRLPDIVMDDHIQFGTGGTCFSLTYFFQTVLQSLGFSAQTAMADRSYGEDTHCAAIVTVDGERYLADPGYCLSQPVSLDRSDSDLPHQRLIITQHENAATIESGISKFTPSPSPLPRGERVTTEGIYTETNNLKTYTISTIQGGEHKVRYLLKDRAVGNDEFLKLWQRSFDWPMMRHLCITTNSQEGYIFLRDKHVRHNTLTDKHQQKIHNDYEKEVSKIFNINPAIIEQAFTITNEAKEVFRKELCDGQ